MKPKLLITEPLNFPEDALETLRGVFRVHMGATTRSDLLHEARDADVILVRLGHRLDTEFFDHAPRLRAIVSATTGLNHIDISTAAQRDIEIISLKGETEFLRRITVTAELTWGLLLALARSIPAACAHTANGGWNRDEFRDGLQLAGRTLGILGYGRLGTIVANYGHAFGMRVLVADVRPMELPPWAEQVSHDALYAESDVITVHVPSAPETHHLVGRSAFARMQRGAVLINTARGDVIDERALVEALETGKIAGAALDVLEDEYDAAATASSLKLRQLAACSRRVLITPHIGGASNDAMARAETFISEKLLRQWLSLSPQN
jgi:D-3-phosphoglycerate dehydrogenase